MKKTITFFPTQAAKMLLATLLLTLTAQTARAEEYEISTLEELRDFMEAVHVNGFARDVIRLTADIDCEGERFNTGDPEYPSTFRGTFDGQGYKIYNFVNTPKGSGDYDGYGTAMFDFAETGATIENLTLEGTLPGTYSGAYSAAFVLAVETPHGLTLNNCHFNGSVTNVYHSAALVGFASSGAGIEVPSITLKNCSANANITTTSNYIAGGLVAKGTGVEAYNCSFNGKVTSLGTVGGLIGEAINCILENCQVGSDFTLSDGATTIGKNAFNGCSGLTSIVIPASVTTIDRGAFANTGLTTVSFAAGSQLTTIGDGAFSNCEGLTSITIPASVTTIGINAFDHCDKLTQVTLPASVTTLNDAAFSGCTSLNTVFLYSVNPPTLGSDVFDGCTALDAIYVPAGTEETYKAADGWKAYASKILAIDGTCGNNVYYSYDSTSKTLNIFGTGAMANYSILNQWDIPWYDYSTDITTVVIADGVTSIGDYAFFGCTSLASITIPASVTSIGSAAFSNCNGLASIEIPIRVTSIGSSAFSGCNSLTSVTIPASVTSIGNEAFKDCTSLTSIEIPASVTSIGNEVFSYCTSLASISVAAGNTKYDSRNNCNALIETKTNTLIAGCKNTVIPDGTDGVTSIGDHAFWGCTDLTTITIPASVTSIGAGAFERCTSLTTIEIPASVTSIGAGAFTGCTSLANFKIPASVTSIGNYAFSDCTSLESITIPDGVTSIGDYAFFDCTSLASITIPASVTSIGAGAFWCCTSLTSIEIPASVTSIGGGAFRDCTSLNSVTIYAPELSEYGWRAFDGNANGRKIYVFENCMDYYKAQASRMSVSEDDIQAITDISLKDNDDNRSLIAAASGNALGTLKVTLKDRTLYKDGAWNTLCLPFALGDDQAASGHELDGTPLEGATLMTLGNSQACNTAFDAQTGTLNLEFLPATTVEPGVAYIVKWPIPDGMTADEFAAAYAANPDDYDLKNPVFTGVTVTNDAPADHATTSLDGYVTFIGTYGPAAIYADPAVNLYLGAANKLYWPSTDSYRLGAFRAYFALGNGLTCGDPSNPNAARAITLNFGDDEATGIVSAEANSSLFTLHFQSGTPSTAASSRPSPARRASTSTEAVRLLLSN